MSICVSRIKAKTILTKSKLPDADYVINPYVGCPHGCIYCYAEFMKRFAKHGEPWGKFVDVKEFSGELNLHRVRPQDTILIGSVTDAYNPLEARFCITRSILSLLSDCTARVEILTKSALVCRDIDLLQNIPNVAVGFSMNTTDDVFRCLIEPHAAPVKERISAMRTLHEAGVSTYLFVAPIFPDISNCSDLLQKTAGLVDYVCFENLNLRGAYRSRVMSMISQYYPEKTPLYHRIYDQGDHSYWDALADELRQSCSSLRLPYRIYFHHGAFAKREEAR